MRARVLVVEHEAGTGPGLVAERLLAADVAAVVVRPYRGDRLPADLAGWEGLVVCGGTMGPHDDTAAPWLEDVRRLLRHALARGTPVLGLCLGGQLLASVAGGRVQPSVRGAEVGLHRLHTTPAAATDPVFSSLPPVIPAVEWHWEEIVELPPGADALLESAAFPHQAFRVGERAWGVQFHLEVLGDDIEAWAAHQHSDVLALGLDPRRVVEDIRAHEPVLRREWGPLCDRWAELLLRHPTAT